MIVTVTLNAALEASYSAMRLSWDEPGEVSRASYRATGRGIAVARVLQTFGHDVLATGLVGGTAGELIRADLARSGVAADFTTIGRESRRLLGIAERETGRVLRLREPGPYVTTEELGRFAADYRRLLADATAVVLCGSLPDGLPQEIYGSLVSYAASAEVPVILDAGGEELRYGARRHPDLVIPDGSVDAAEAAGDLGRVAVAVPGSAEVRAVTPEGEWTAVIEGVQDADDIAGGMSRAALVAGLVPGLLLDWSWPDRLRHALALSFAVSQLGEVDSRAYERLLSAVRLTSSKVRSGRATGRYFG